MLSVSLHFCCSLGPPFVVAMPALFCHMNRQVRLHLRCQLVIFYASSLHHFYSLVARVFLCWSATRGLLQVQNHTSAQLLQYTNGSLGACLENLLNLHVASGGGHSQQVIPSFCWRRAAGSAGSRHMLVPVQDIRVTKHLVLALLLCSNSFPAWIFALAARALNEIILMPL